MVTLPSLRLPVAWLARVIRLVRNSSRAKAEWAERWAPKEDIPKEDIPIPQGEAREPTPGEKERWLEATRWHKTCYIDYYPEGNPRPIVFCSVAFLNKDNNIKKNKSTELYCYNKSEAEKKLNLFTNNKRRYGRYFRGGGYNSYEVFGFAGLFILFGYYYYYYSLFPTIYSYACNGPLHSEGVDSEVYRYEVILVRPFEGYKLTPSTN
ncbi:hypothetical protein NEUTE1DRAFT_110752 [Neurospora tetrasperma FGSC 2508]|uniref:Uncharacterized protein n=1 Tax=Neurospora tetrasperma (strain FGSC 2508 / ATCC MYA-4615 / P0657) TaxID=510951 RepID=F8MNR7_NEUT8|nr:uncharacterized protein NEUTE1DRAFT_110752 [Neurospora tetrasperma FGSC 2508]EGO56189.1 hypothetical protein NEUTE1DRAFT_110752 [Neurospora tetrasperma FGSC 2508]EGZ70956.1 hypothetical protein NEUTE2DRAFT_140291 [Neurospora tetrasperma FGSC 2509]